MMIRTSAVWLILLLSACARTPGEASLVTGVSSSASATGHACLHVQSERRTRLALPAPDGGWSGAPQAVVVSNVFSGQVDLYHRDQVRCGSPQDARSLDSRFNTGVGTVFVPATGDAAPVEIEFDDDVLPLWRPIVHLGQPAPVQRSDTRRFAARIALLVVVMTLVLSSLLSFAATRERAFLAYAATATLFAAWLALLSGLWAWPQPWLPVGTGTVPLLVSLALIMAAFTTLALVRQSGLRLRMPRLDRTLVVIARVLVLVAVLLPLAPASVLGSVSVVIESTFYLVCLGFAVGAVIALSRGGRGVALLAGVMPFLGVGAMQVLAPDALAFWKVEAFMTAGAWLALTCSMVLSLRLGHLRRQRDEMSRLAQTDALTGLPNRRASLERLEQGIATARASSMPLSVVFFDIDHFKRINDVHGHEIGDRVLRHVAQMLRGAFRNADHVARIGGEEFLVLMPGAEPAQAQGRIDTLRALLANSATLLDVPGLEVTLSAGVSALEAADTHGEALMRRADAAMYVAKRGGRNRTETAVFDSA